MVGISVAILVSIGSAAGVLAALARRHAPEDGWRGLLRSGVHAARAKELSFVDHHRRPETPPGGLDELFTIAKPDEWPAYTEVPQLRSALSRIRRAGRHRAAPATGAPVRS